MNFLDTLYRLLLGEPRAPKPTGNNLTPRGFGIHVGVNKVNPQSYDGWEGPLNACENDARHMSHMLEQRGYETTILLTRNATSHNFFKALGAVASEAKKGDIVVVSNSSHGSQVPDRDNDESDRMDETICLWDRQVLDDELEAAWAMFAPGVRIVFISDSCHSGTMVRAFGQTAVTMQEGSRAAPPDVQARVAELHAETYRQAAEAVRDRAAIKAHVLAFGACQDNQTAMDGRVNGAFTGALLRTLKDYPTDNLGRVITRVRRSLPSTQTPHYTYFGPRLDSFEKAVAFSIR
jgi:metacaspase-1